MDELKYYKYYNTFSNFFKFYSSFFVSSAFGDSSFLDFFEPLFIKIIVVILVNAIATATHTPNNTNSSGDKLIPVCALISSVLIVATTTFSI